MYHTAAATMWNSYSVAVVSFASKEWVRGLERIKNIFES